MRLDAAYYDTPYNFWCRNLSPNYNLRVDFIYLTLIMIINRAKLIPRSDNHSFFNSGQYT